MIVKYDLHKDKCIYKVRVRYCTWSEFSFGRLISNLPVAQYFKHSDLPVISIHKVSLILHLDFLFCIGHTDWINTKTATNNGSTFNAQNCLCLKRDLHVFLIRKIVCFIVIVTYSDLHVVSIHTC